MSEAPKGPSEFVTEAYALTDSESTIEFYRKWAQDYDSQMLSKGYSAPRRVVQFLEEYIPGNNLDVLDLGCGTGLTGKHIHAMGISHLDGIDISGEMIEVARARKIYRNLYIADVNQQLGIPDRQYDAVVSSGTFTHGHVGPEPIPEIVRILKPGGLLACTVHFELWHGMKFDAMFANLMKNKQIQCLALRDGPYYENSATEGWYCLYQKLPQLESST